MKYKSYIKAEQHAISSICNDGNVGYVILSERKWFRKYYYINYYLKNIIDKLDEIK